jgi:hypothetical protein
VDQVLANASYRTTRVYGGTNDPHSAMLGGHSTLNTVVLGEGTVWDRLFPMRNKNFYRQVLKLGTNEASDQGLQNAIYNECHTNFLTKLWAFENRKFVWWLYGASV